MRLAILCVAKFLCLSLILPAEANSATNCESDLNVPSAVKRGDLVKVPNSQELSGEPEFGLVEKTTARGIQVRVQTWKYRCNLKWLVGDSNCYSEVVPTQKLKTYQPNAILRFCQKNPSPGLTSGETILLRPNSWSIRRVSFLATTADETEIAFKTFKSDGIDHKKELFGSIRLTDINSEIGRKVNTHGPLIVGEKYTVTNTGLVSQPQFEVVAQEVYSNGFAVGRPLQTQDGIIGSVIFTLIDGKYILSGFANLEKK